VNNAEIGYTFKSRYNFKAGISRTDNQITRLIAPDSIHPRAGYITWENIASRTVVSLNASAPVQITPKWNAYFNVNVSHINNQARYPNGAVIDVQVFSYNIYHQQTFDLPFDLKRENFRLLLRFPASGAVYFSMIPTGASISDCSVSF
jgi:hypothetical protein